MEKFSIINRKGLKIVGELHLPENPIGLAFVEHGLGGYKEQPVIAALVDTLFLNNYVVLNIDATNSFNESEGNFERATMQLHYEDLVDVIEWAKNQKWYKEPFVLAGHSLGGYAVAQYAEDYPIKVKGVFPLALVVSGELSLRAYEKFESEKIKKWKESGWDERISVSKPGLVKRLPWSSMEERLNHDLRPMATNLIMPILFVVGENDHSCPPDSQKALYDIVPGLKEFHVITGASHTFRDISHINELKDFFNNWLNKLN